MFRRNISTIGIRCYHTIKREYALPLYAHETKTPEEITISFSKDPSALPVGTLKESMKSFTSANRSLPTSIPLLPSKFTTHPEFTPLLFQVLKSHIHECSMFQSFGKAEAPHTAFYSVYDFRNPPTYGRIPEVEDILGSVRLDKNGIVKESFDKNSMYRTATRMGFIELTDHIHEKVRSACEKR